jgi:outer membrane protein
MKKLFIASLATCTLLGSALPALATSNIFQNSHTKEAEGMGTRDWKDWDVTVGLGAEYEPVSPGIDETEVSPIPYVDIEYKERFFLKTQRGLGAYVLRSMEDPGYGMGVAVSYDQGRDESDAPKQLEGLGDIDASPEAIVFFEGEAGPIELELELAQGLTSDGHNGFRAEFSAEVDAMVTERLFLGAGPFISYADEQYTESYYGITSKQAARSATYNQYDVSGGFESVGIEASGRYMVTRNWSVLGIAEYTQLMGDAKDSPIVDEEGFFSVGAAVAYSF